MGEGVIPVLGDVRAAGGVAVSGWIAAAEGGAFVGKGVREPRGVARVFSEADLLAGGGVEDAEAAALRSDDAGLAAAALLDELLDV